MIVRGSLIYDWCPYKKRKKNTERMPCNNRARDWSDAAISQAKK